MNEGHKKRLRDRYLSSGLGAFADYEVIELLLGIVDVRKDCKKKAKILCEKFGSLKEVLDAPYEELVEVEGIGHRSAEMIMFIKDLITQYLHSEMKDIGNVIDSPEAVVSYFTAYFGGSLREEFCVAFVNSAGKIIHVERYQPGTVNFSYVYPRNIIADALKYEAAGIIMIHNHPSGKKDPSAADIDFTKRIAEIAGKMEIGMLDHLIITGQGYFSFKEGGLI